MNNTSDILTRCCDAIQKGSLGGIILSKNPSIDSVAAATALYLGLSKLGKPISIACANPIKTDVYASEKISNNIATNGDNLVISFPYTEGAIDKVDYNIQGDIFNLIITPRQGQAKLDPGQVNYSYSGGSLDFIITIDAPSLQSLDSIYSDNQKMFEGREIINIDRHLTNAQFGTINIVNKNASSISELILPILKGLNIEIDKEMATNLYIGICSATNNFTSYSANAFTFETVAELLRLGAVKKRLKPQQQQAPQPQQQIQPTAAPITLEQQPPTQLKSEKPLEQIEKAPIQEGQGKRKQTPQEWLKPRIFKGTGMI